jgi:hypothetical protein
MLKPYLGIHVDKGLKWAHFMVICISLSFPIYFLCLAKFFDEIWDVRLNCNNYQSFVIIRIEVGFPMEGSDFVKMFISMGQFLQNLEILLLIKFFFSTLR